MKKAFSTAALVVVIALFAATFVKSVYEAVAQTTNVIPVEFALAFRPSNDLRPIKYSDPYASWGNSRGDIAISVLPDSAALMLAYGANAKIWVMTITDTTRTGSTATGVINFSIIDLDRTASLDTSLFISGDGLYCTGLLPNVDVVISPYDSLEKYDQLVFAWLDRQWQ